VARQAIALALRRAETRTSNTMSGVLETVKVHEVAGVFRSREDLDGAVDDLLLAGFDRADIDLMASRDAVREKLGKIYIATEELPDIRSVPRQAYVARHEATGALVLVAGVLTTVGVTLQHSASLPPVELWHWLLLHRPSAARAF
jgi:hypothetical protein